MRKIITLIAAAFRGRRRSQIPRPLYGGFDLRSQFNLVFAPLRGCVNIPGLGGTGHQRQRQPGPRQHPLSAQRQAGDAARQFVSSADALANQEQEPAGLRLEDQHHRLRRSPGTTNFWSSTSTPANADVNLPTRFEFLKRGPGRRHPRHRRHDPTTSKRASTTRSR